MLTELTKTSLKTNTDKSFWHKYTEVYDSIFKKIRSESRVPSILEYGVFKGESIQTYLDFFPNSVINGLDILPERPEWPKDSKVTYHKVDQSQRHQIKDLLARINLKFDLVIEDGGHRPDQQFNSLIETLPYMKLEGSVYILEDLHTSMPGHPLNQYFRLFGEKYPGNCYSLLLAIKHLRELEELGKLTTQNALSTLISKFRSSSMMSATELEFIYSKIQTIEIFKRADLPLACWQCRSEDFDYLNLKCSKCGKKLIGVQESLAAILHIKSVR